MSQHLTISPDRYAIIRLNPDADIPAWVERSAFWSVARSPDELSIICAESVTPPEISAERGWRLLKVEGPFPFETVGVLAGLVAPLAAANISVLALATFDTDYLLIREHDMTPAVQALQAAKHITTEAKPAP